MALTQAVGEKMPVSSSIKLSASCRKRRGTNLSRIWAPQAYRPVELNAKPTTGLPSRTMSVPTATIEVVYCLKPPQKISKDWTLVHTLDVDF